MTALFIVVSPVVGYIGSAIMTVGCSWLLRSDATLARSIAGSGGCSSVSAAAFSLGHGGNDAQKTMGIIVVLLYSQGLPRGPLSDGARHADVDRPCLPRWRWASARMSGGWRIVKTMGMRLTKLRPFGGFCAETAGRSPSSWPRCWAVPVSTTHTITGAIVGVGSTSSPGKVRWGVAGRIVWAWIFTIPAAAAISAVAYFIARALLA